MSQAGLSASSESDCELVNDVRMKIVDYEGRKLILR